jgi:hypothetical protein
MPNIIQDTCIKKEFSNIVSCSGRKWLQSLKKVLISAKIFFNHQSLGRVTKIAEFYTAFKTDEKMQKLY